MSRNPPSKQRGGSARQRQQSRPTQQPTNNARAQATPGKSNRGAVASGLKRDSPVSGLSDKKSQSTSPKRTAGGERGLTHGEKQFTQIIEGKAFQHEQSSGKRITEVREWLELLQKQTDSGEYDLKVFSNIPGGSDVETGKCGKAVKEICSKLKNRTDDQSKESGALYSQVEALSKKLQSACEEVSKEKTGSRNEGKGKAEAKRVPLEHYLTASDKNADKLIEKVQQTSKKLGSLEDYCCNEVGKLCAKLQDACNDSQLKSESSDKTYRKKETKDPKSPLRQCMEAANTHADRLIEHLEITRSTSGVKGKAQGKQVQNAAEQETKAKIAAITEWLNKLKKQVDGCKYDVTVFQKLKYKEDGSHEEMTKCKACLADICNKLENTSDNDKRQSDANFTMTKELKKQNDLVRKMWTEAYNEPKGEPTDTISALNDLKKCLTDNKKSLSAMNEIQENLKSEISLLKEEIKRFDEETEVTFAKTNGLKLEIVQDIRYVRKELNDKKKEMAKATNNRAKDKKQEETKVRQHVVSLWKVAFGTDRDLTDSEGDDGRTQTILSMLNDITPEFEKLEKISFSLEAESNDIHKDLMGVSPFNKDTEELKTPIAVLHNTLQTLKSCCSETKVFAANFAELDKAVSIESTNTTISGKCNLMTEAVQRRRIESKDMISILQKCQKFLPMAYLDLLGEPYCFVEPHIDSESIKERFPEWLQDIAFTVSRIRGCIKTNKDSFHKRFINVDIYDKLKKENRGLLDEMAKMKADKDDALNRLSKVAGARLTDNNPNIADLSDPNRPTRLAEHYSELYDSPWTDAFETLNLDERSCIDFLLQILVDCYKCCGDISVNHQNILKRVLCNPVEGMGTKQAKKSKDKENSGTLSAVQSNALSELRKQGADMSVISVKELIKIEHEDWFKTDNLEKYTVLCIELCWLMNVQSPPVFLESSVKSGTPFDTNRYKQYTKAGKKIDFLVWPALLLHEGGAILCKGVAQGK